MSNRDVNGVIRGACSECECKEFLAGEKVRCVTCDHVPNKHCVAASTSEKKPEVEVNFHPNLGIPLQHSYGVSNDFTMSANINNNNNPFSDTISTTESVTCQSISNPNKIGNADNVDVRGMARYNCSMCPCTMYKRPAQGAKCSSCSHPPIKHSTVTPSQDISSFTQPILSLNNYETPTHSKVSTLVNIAPTTSDTATATATASHHVMTSFKSDPPDVVSVSADNLLIVPTGQAVKITIEINIVPMEK